jgi:hypothetical protein
LLSGGYGVIRGASGGR